MKSQFRAPAAGVDPQLISRGQPDPGAEVQTILQGLKVGDHVRRAIGSQDEHVRPGTTCHAVIACAVHHDVMACATVDRIGTCTAGQDVIQRPARHDLCGTRTDLGQAAVRCVDRKTGDARFGFTCRKKPQALPGREPCDGRDIGKGRADRVGHAVEVKQPPAGQEQERGQTVIRPACDDETAVSDGDRLKRRHAMEAGRQVVQDVIYRDQRAACANRENAERGTEGRCQHDILTVAKLCRCHG